MMPPRFRGQALVALCLMTCWEIGSGSALAGSSATFSMPAGSYCALPQPGEEPQCLEPARADYGAFFAAVEAGRIDASAAARIESDLAADPGSQRAYLALSSLAYGYLNLAQNASKTAEQQPLLAARLEAWNRLLISTYAEPASPEHFRMALREAAEDIHDRVARFATACGNGSSECSAGLMTAMAQVDEATSLRSPLKGLVNRIRGEN